jgi:hypothetical protein
VLTTDLSAGFSLLVQAAAIAIGVTVHNVPRGRLSSLSAASITGLKASP